MAQKYLVDLRDKIGVFGFESFVDEFGHKKVHHLMKENYECNNVFYVYFGCAVYCFSFVEKLDNFHFGLVKLLGNR